jgi:hypothetical protein
MAAIGTKGLFCERVALKGETPRIDARGATKS